MINLYSII